MRQFLVQICLTDNRAHIQEHIKYCRSFFYLATLLHTSVYARPFYQQRKIPQRLPNWLDLHLDAQNESLQSAKKFAPNFIRSKIHVCAVHSPRRCFGLDWSAFIRIMVQSWKKDERNERKKDHAAKQKCTEQKGRNSWRLFSSLFLSRKKWWKITF